MHTSPKMQAVCPGFCYMYMPATIAHSSCLTNMLPIYICCPPWFLLHEHTVHTNICCPSSIWLHVHIVHIICFCHSFCFIHMLSINVLFHIDDVQSSILILYHLAYSCVLSYISMLGIVPFSLILTMINPSCLISL